MAQCGFAARATSIKKCMSRYSFVVPSRFVDIPFTEQIIEELHFPSALQVIISSPAGPYPSLQDCIAVALYVVSPSTVR